MSSVTENIQTETVMSFIFAASAADNVADLNSKEDYEDLKLRGFIDSSELFYRFALNQDHTTMDETGVSVSIDAIDSMYKSGAEIDYKNDLAGTRLLINNSPSNIATFGCVSSLSLNVGISS